MNHENKPVQLPMSEMWTYVGKKNRNKARTLPRLQAAAMGRFPQAKGSKRKTFLYVVKPEGFSFVKIGCSTNVRNRLATLRAWDHTAKPQQLQRSVIGAFPKLTVLCICEADPDYELYAHCALRRFRVSGTKEWYHHVPEVDWSLGLLGFVPFFSKKLYGNVAYL
jgi:hypothetical protein